MTRIAHAAALAVALWTGATAVAAPLVVPFDFSRSAIGLDVTIHGTPLHMLLDTGVDPSVIDLARAGALGLAVDRGAGGEASGFGDGKGAAVFASRIEGLALGGRGFAPFAALASDLHAVSDHYGRPLDGVLGYSFLVDKAVLIDYPGRTIGILERGDDPALLVGGCRDRWSAPLRTVESFPIIPGFRLGKARGPVTLDTGSNGSIGLYRSALGLPGVRASMTANGTVTHAGSRGETTSASYVFDAPVGFGPFVLPAGQPVVLNSQAGSRRTNVANIGNSLVAAMQVKLLLDYRRRTITVYGRCP